MLVPFATHFRFRVMMAVLVPLVIILTLAALVQFRQHRALVVSNLEQFSVGIGSAVEATLTRSMLNQDHGALEKVAQDLAAGGSIRNLMILDKQGIVRVASQTSQLGAHLALTDPTCQICHQSALPLASKSVVFTAADGTRVFRNVTPIRNEIACQGCHGAAAALNGVLIVDLPYDLADAQLWSDLAQNLGLALGGIALVALAMYVSLSRVVIAPLERFRHAIAHYAHGDFAARVPVVGSDELGVLARTVNEMATGLEEKVALQQQVQQTAHELQTKSERLSALYRVALESSRSLNLDQVMRAGLENALAVSGMDAGEIHLSAGARDLRLRASIGAPPEFLAAEAVIARGECVCGRVALTGRTDLLDDLGKHPRVTRLACLKHGYRAIVAVPLRAHGETLGVLTLHSRVPRAFSLEDNALLSAIGEQLGVAVDNAQLYAEMESRVQDLSRQVEHLAVLDERERIAREMHDGFAQTLGVLNLKLGMAQLETGQTPTLKHTLSEIRSIVDEAYEDVRQAINDLRLPLPGDKRLARVIAEYAENFALRYGLVTHVTTEPDAEPFDCDPAVRGQVMRIVQETLANVRKHSRATEVRVELTCGVGQLHIAISDNGRGFDPAAQTRARDRFGLAIMRERAAGFGGTLTVESHPGRGTRVTLTVPMALSENIISPPARPAALELELNDGESARLARG